MNKKEYNHTIKCLIILVVLLIIVLVVSITKDNENVCKVNLYKGSENYIQANHIKDLFNWSMYGKNVIIQNVVPISSWGYSMQPNSFTGQTDLAIDYNGQELKEGMVIVYTSEDGKELIGHRIRGNYGDYVITQGDNSNSQETVNLTQIKYIIVGTLYT